MERFLLETDNFSGMNFGKDRLPVNNSSGRMIRLFSGIKHIFWRIKVLCLTSSKMNDLSLVQINHHQVSRCDWNMFISVSMRD